MKKSEGVRYDGMKKGWNEGVTVRDSGVKESEGVNIDTVMME